MHCPVFSLTLNSILLSFLLRTSPLEKLVLRTSLHIHLCKFKTSKYELWKNGMVKIKFLLCYRTTS